MTGTRFARVDRRAFLSGVAVCAFAGATLAPLAARAQQADDGQAEWRQSYETSDRVSIGRESTPTMSPATVDATEKAIELYQSIVSRGGWNAVPAVELKIGSKSKAVQALRQRLVASGDLDQEAGMGPVFDSFVDAAVKRFQVRHGLEATGVVNEETLAALNVPADARLQQLETNIVRLRAYSGDLGQRFVMVNIPAAEVETVEGRRRSFPPRRRRRQDRPPVADHADQGDRGEFQPVLDGAAVADQERPHPQDAGRSRPI